MVSTHRLRGGHRRPVPAAAAVTGQQFPATAQAMVDLGMPAPSYIWLCDEASGDLVDEIGSQALADFGSPVYAQPCTGFTGKTGVEWSGAVSFLHAVNTFLNRSATQSIAVLVVFRLEAASNGYNLIQKGAVWELQHRNSGGLRILFPGSLIDLAENHANGVFHYVCFVSDQTAQNTRFFSDLSAQQTGAESGAMGNGVVQLGSGIAGNRETQVPYVCVWLDAAAESITRTLVQAEFWVGPA